MENQLLQISGNVRFIAKQISGAGCSLNDIPERPNCFWINGPRQTQGMAIPRLLVVVELSMQDDLSFAQSVSVDGQRTGLNNLKDQLGAAWEQELERSKTHLASTEPRFTVSAEMLGL
jgi:hypothetical protein